MFYTFQLCIETVDAYSCLLKLQCFQRISEYQLQRIAALQFNSR